jgi:hypothetical protein
MKTFTNLVLGCAVAAVVLAPVAWADANRLLDGRAPTLAHSASASASQAVAALPLPFPHLFACLFASLSAAQPGRH